MSTSRAGLQPGRRSRAAGVLPPTATRLRHGPAQEREAKESARPGRRNVRSSPVRSARTLADPALGDPLVDDPGRPLSDDERAPMEWALGADFSQVRVHTDRAEADDRRAKAFTHGRDVVFGPGQYAPGTAAGRGLLAHELTHTLQQADAGQPAVQCDPKDAEAAKGVGSAPPSESFNTMGSPGVEDGFALFGMDTAELSPDGERAILALIGRPTAPLTVHVHGYASREGDSQYNFNLSAHRGAAVKRLLQAHLPTDSTILIYAHGETKAFGDAADNRRVGVDVVEEPPRFGFKPKWQLGEQSYLKPPDDLPFGAAPSTKPWTTPPLVGDPKFTLPPPVLRDPIMITPPPPIWLTPVPAIRPRRDLMDLPGITSPFASHGASPAEGGNIVLEWDRTFGEYKGLGFSDALAARLANMKLSSAAQAYFERNQPNALDRSNAEWRAAHPDATTVGPIMSPNLLEAVPQAWDWLTKKKKKSK